MSTITLGAQTAAPTPARSESKGDTGDAGAAGFGAALADAMAPERPAAAVGRGHGHSSKHSTQPKTDAAPDSSAATPVTDDSAAQTPVPTPNPLALLAAASGAITAEPAVPESQSAAELPSVPELLSVPELVAGPRTGASTSSATGVSPVPEPPSPSVPGLPSVPELVEGPGIGASTSSATVTSGDAVTSSAAAVSAVASTSSPIVASADAPTNSAATASSEAPALGVSATLAAPVVPSAVNPASTARPAEQSAPAAEPAAALTPLAAQAAAAVPGSVVAGSVRDEKAPRIADASVSGAAGAVQPAPASGVQTATSASPVAAPQAPAPANAPTFAAQLAKPLFTLATSPAGDHIVTVKVTPENLGPVTVRAHIGAEGVRMELFAPNDAGREALRSILTDLRRDLASQGASANLDLSSQNQPTDSGDRDARQGASALPDRQTSSAVEPEIATTRRVFASMSSLDVLA